MVAVAERRPHNTNTPLTELPPYAERLEERRQEMLRELPDYRMTDWFTDARIYKNNLYPEYILDASPNVGIWGFTVVDPLNILATDFIDPIENYYEILTDLDGAQHYSKRDPRNINDFRHRGTQYMMYANADFFVDKIFSSQPDETLQNASPQVNTHHITTFIEADIPRAGRADLVIAVDGKRFHIVEIGTKGKHGQAEEYAKKLRERYNLPTGRVTWTVAHYLDVDRKGGDVVLIVQNGVKRAHDLGLRNAA